jgi:3-hydroxyisobutyrate dehydrogenase-like beta-hydroxyacid dehydrogenase
VRGVEDVGIVGVGDLGAELARLAEAADYRVYRVDPDPRRAQVQRVKDLRCRLDLLCICVPRPPQVYRVVAEYLRLAPGLRPARLLAMAAMGPGHVKRIDALLGRLEPEANFAECSLLDLAAWMGMSSHVELQ